MTTDFNPVEGAEVSVGAFTRTALYSDPIEFSAYVDFWINNDEERRRHVVAWLRAVAAEVEVGDDD